MKLTRILPSVLLIAFSSVTVAQNLDITSVDPAPNAANVAANADITVTFDQAVVGATLTSATVVVRGSQTGVLPGVLSGGGTNVVTFNATNNFKPGETVSITITKNLIGLVDGQGLLRGHTYSFTVVTGAPESSPIAFGQRNITFNQGLSPTDIKALDVENDGDMDLVIGNAEPFGNDLMVWSNDGTQKFCPQSLVASDGNRIAEMDDLDGDGDKDGVLMRSNSSGLAWARNNGDGTFTSVLINGAVIPFSGSSRNGDLDSDGDVDFLVYAGGGGNGVRWYENNGSASFTARTVSAGNGGTYTYLQMADVNTDGAMDVIAYRPELSLLAWYENNGSQVFTERVLANTSDNLEMTPADLDDDGDIDIIASSRNNNITLNWYVNDGNENFTVQTIPLLSGASDGLLRIVDVDGDLDKDIVCGSQWLENNGSEVFSAHKLGSDLQQSNSVDCVDMDNDGDMDLVTVGNSLQSQFFWFENTKLMNVTSVSPLNASHNVDANTDITITFDQPIDATTVTSNSVIVKSKYRGLIPGVLGVSGNTITFNPLADLMQNDDVSVAVNNLVRSTSDHSLERNYGFDFKIRTTAAATPTFGPAQTIFTFPATPLELDVADFDHDGDLDVFASTASAAHWYRNDGAGNFTQILIPTTGTILYAKLWDFNRDGWMDIAVHTNPGFVATGYMNDASQSFTPTPIPRMNTLAGYHDVDRDGYDDNLGARYYHGSCNDFFEQSLVGSTSNSNGYAAGDFNGDGYIDLIRSTNRGEFHQSDGSNGFTSTTLASIGIQSTARGDLDGDGDYDALFAVTTALYWYRNNLNTASANFMAMTGMSNLGESRMLVTADFDGDGDLDLAGAGTRFGAVVMRNRLNEATANFTLSQTLLAPTVGPVAIRAGDFNGDGKTDLVVISNVENTLKWFSNSGAAPLPPTVTGMTPGEGPWGDFVRITGTNFSLSPSGNVVRFNGVAATVSASTATTIDTYVPSGATTGTVTVTVGSNTATSSTQFRVTPNILDFQPNSGPVGTEVILTGTSFGATPSANTVYFNGTEAEIISSTTSTIVTRVPPGATSGYIEVHTSEGFGSTDDSAFQVTGGSGAQIVFDVHPHDVEACPGSPVTFTTLASGDTGIFYDWQYSTTLAGPYHDIGDSDGYEGANTSELTVLTIGGTGAGFYRCRAAGDTAPMALTGVASLTFLACDPPVIATQRLSTGAGGIITIDLVPLITTDNLDIGSLQVIGQPASGANASVDSDGILTIDYSGVVFTGSESVEIFACDLSNGCSSQTFDIDVIGEIEVYNAVSPEGKNPILMFRFIEILPDTRDNKVVIYNRWGDAVFEIDNYNNTTNVFAGVSSNGGKLPSGTYYYKVTFASGRQNMTGFLELRY